MSDDLTYRPPPRLPKSPMIRRVYVLERDMLKRIHAVGYAENIQTEVDIVRMLLAEALDHRERAASA